MLLRRRNSLRALAIAAASTALLAGGAPAWAGAGGGGGGAGRAASGGTWQQAAPVAGLPALNAGGGANALQVSCSSAGNCAVGGFYRDKAHDDQAFVVSEEGGRWARAIEVPGTAALNTGEGAATTSVYCPAAGDCAADGTYLIRSKVRELFVVSEHDGRWGQAAEVPGLAGLNVGFGADIGQLACPSPGNCVAGGDYVNSLGVLKAFAVSEVRGHWEPAVPLSGAGLKASEYSSMTSASCSSAGNCTLAGTDRPATSAGNQAIVVRERDGQWGQATAISVPASLGSISMNIGTLSCAGDSSATQGNCLAGGFYETTAMRYRAWVVSEAGGRWGRALLVPGILTLNVGGLAVVNQVSCAAPGDCAAGGYYSDHAGTQAFLASQAGGRWGQAVEVPGLAALNTSGYAETASVSCPSAGNCAAVGWYNGRAGVQDFVIDQNAGRWGQAVEVPGLAALNARHVAHINSVSCPAAGRCVMAGEYADQAGQSEVFTDSQK